MSGSTAMQKKVQEADLQVKEADKLTTKTLFRWKLDWDTASSMYESAATTYRNAKSYEKAKDTFIKAAVAMDNNQLGFNAAKNYDAAAMMAKELDQSSEAADLYEKASSFYRIEGSGEKAAETLIKAAKAVEELDADRSIQLCLNACEIYGEDQKELYSGQAYRTAISLLLRNQKFDKTIELLVKQHSALEKTKNYHDLNKNLLSLIVIHLHRGDYVAAEKVFQETAAVSPDFPISKEGKAGAELLDAFQNMNKEALQKCTKQQVFDFLDNQVTKIAKNLKLSEIPEKEEIA